MKKLFIMMGIWFVLVVSIIVGSEVYDHLKTSKYDAAAAPYLEQVVPELSRWDAAEIKPLMEPEALAKIPEEQYTATIKLFSKLGSLRSMETPKFSQVHSEDSTSALVEYTVPAKYENGDATLTINLLHKDGQFSIYHFNVKSKALGN